MLQDVPHNNCVVGGVCLPDSFDRTELMQYADEKSRYVITCLTACDAVTWAGQ
jgi:hypothetical protein